MGQKHLMRDTIRVIGLKVEGLSLTFSEASLCQETYRKYVRGDRFYFCMVEIPVSDVNSCNKCKNWVESLTIKQNGKYIDVGDLLAIDVAYTGSLTVKHMLKGTREPKVSGKFYYNWVQRTLQQGGVLYCELLRTK